MATTLVVHIRVSAFHVTCRSCGHVAKINSGLLAAWARAHQQPWLEGLYSTFNDGRPEYQTMRRARLLR
jgi:hypothetical protein